MKRNLTDISFAAVCKINLDLQFLSVLIARNMHTKKHYGWIGVDLCQKVQNIDGIKLNFGQISRKVNQSYNKDHVLGYIMNESSGFLSLHLHFCEIKVKI